MFLCKIFGHHWHRHGYPDGTELLWCARCKKITKPEHLNSTFPAYPLEAPHGMGHATDLMEEIYHA